MTFSFKGIEKTSIDIIFLEWCHIEIAFIPLEADKKTSICED